MDIVYKHILFTLTRDQLLRQTKLKKKIVTIDTAQVNIKEVMVFYFIDEETRLRC